MKPKFNKAPLIHVFVPQPRAKRSLNMRMLRYGFEEKNRRKNEDNEGVPPWIQSDRTEKIQWNSVQNRSPELCNPKEEDRVKEKAQKFYRCFYALKFGMLKKILPRI